MISRLAERGIILFRLPEELREKEILWRRIIIFTLLLGAVVWYFPEILQILATLVWLCLPFIIGGIMAFILNTFTHVIIRFCRRMIDFRLTRKVEIYFKVLTVFIVLIIAIFTLASVIPQLFSSLERLITNIPGMVVEIYERILQWASGYPVLQTWLENNEETFLNASMLFPSVVSFITRGGIGEAFTGISSALYGTVGWLWIVFISIMFSFIAFFNTNHFVKECRMIGKAYLSVKQYRITSHIIHKTSRIFSQYLGGTLLECVILGTLVTIVNSILQIPYALLIGIFCGIFGLVPMFGATFAALISALFLSAVSPVKALTFFVAFVILQQIEGNFIYPNVVSKSIGLPSMYVLMSITIGTGIAGVFGIILAIPVTTVVYELVKEDARRRILAKNYPLPSEEDGEVQ